MSSTIKRTLAAAAVATTALVAFAPVAGTQGKASAHTYDLSSMSTGDTIGSVAVRPSAHTVQVGVEIDAGALPAATYTVAMVAGNDLVNFSSARVFTFTVDASRKGGCNRTMHTSLLDRGYQNEAIDVFAGHGGISVDNLQAVGLIRFMGSDV